jgi:2-aminoadipate transaminase
VKLRFYQSTFRVQFRASKLPMRPPKRYPLEELFPSNPITLAPRLDGTSSTPIYRQLYEEIRLSIQRGALLAGDRLPPTRELAGQLGLNRTTVSAAYDLLEEAGLIRGQVGRGSFVAAPAGPISFATSRPLEELFPINEFRQTVADVVADGSLGSILQLGAPQGYAPLRRYLGGVDTILITSGCQQALDLIQRCFAPAGSTVLVEDPAYPGLKKVFEGAGVRLLPMEQAAGGEILIVTPTFHNPTGRTLTLEERLALLRRARDLRLTVVEIDIYSGLRYRGEPLPSLAELDGTGSVIQIGSFSKVAFPGLRVGWIKASRDVVDRLTQVKQWMDLHSDQLSQAVLLRFAESGRLEEHRQRMIRHGAEQLEAAIQGLAQHLPAGSRFSRPEGGMNLWVELPAPLDAEALLAQAQREGVTYLPARYFQVARSQTGAFRLSFGGLSPGRIAQGVALLGKAFSRPVREVATAMV